MDRKRRISILGLPPVLLVLYFLESFLAANHGTALRSRIHLAAHDVKRVVEFIKLEITVALLQSLRLVRLSCLLKFLRRILFICQLVLNMDVERRRRTAQIKFGSSRLQILFSLSVFHTTGGAQHCQRLSSCSRSIHILACLRRHQSTTVTTTGKSKRRYGTRYRSLPRTFIM